VIASQSVEDKDVKNLSALISNLLESSETEYKYEVIDGLITRLIAKDIMDTLETPILKALVYFIKANLDKHELIAY
jgi:hypothetical protein